MADNFLNGYIEDCENFDRIKDLVTGCADNLTYSERAEILDDINDILGYYRKEQVFYDAFCGEMILRKGMGDSETFISDIVSRIGAKESTKGEGTWFGLLSAARSKFSLDEDSFAPQNVNSLRARYNKLAYAERRNFRRMVKGLGGMVNQIYAQYTDLAKYLLAFQVKDEKKAAGIAELIASGELAYVLKDPKLSAYCERLVKSNGATVNVALVGDKKRYENIGKAMERQREMLNGLDEEKVSSDFVGQEK